MLRWPKSFENKNKKTYVYIYIYIYIYSIPEQKFIRGGQKKKSVSRLSHYSKYLPAGSLDHSKILPQYRGLANRETF